MNQPIPTRSAARHLWLTTLGAAAALVTLGGAMLTFNPSDDSSQRAHFVAAVEQDIAMAQRNVTELEKAARSTSAEAKTRLDAEVLRVQIELRASEAKLAEMQQAGGGRWREFQADMSAATARLRASYTATVPS